MVRLNWQCVAEILLCGFVKMTDIMKIEAKSDFLYLPVSDTGKLYSVKCSHRPVRFRQATQHSDSIDFNRL